MTKEQFELIENDIKEKMEDFSARAKVLGMFDGYDFYDVIGACSLRIFISNTLHEKLLEYAKANFNDLQVVMSRAIEINDYNMHYSEVQGFVDEFGLMNFYDGIFHYEFRGTKLERVYLKFQSVGMKGAYYSRWFLMETYNTDGLKWKITINFKQESDAYIYDEDRLENRLNGRRRGRIGW